MSHRVNTYWRNVLTIVPVVGAVVATLVYLLRLYCRRLKSLKLMVEDYLMGIGLVISYCATAFVLLTAFNGVGLPVASLPKYERKNIQFGSWMIQKFWAPSMAFVKISIILFIKRLFGSMRSYVIIAYCLSAFIALWAISALMVNIFQCKPVQYYYDKDLDGHCMKGQVQFFQAMGSIALIEDVIILCLPIPVFWRLKIDTRQKIALTVVFSLGGLVCIFSLMRLIEFRQFQVTDLASSSAKESIWTCLELDMAIICGCLPFLNPIVQSCRSKVRSVASRYYSHSNTGSNMHLKSKQASKNGFQELGSDRGGQRQSKGLNAATSSQQSSDIESNRQTLEQSGIGQAYPMGEGVNKK